MCGPPCAPMLSSLFSGGAPKNVQLGFELSTYISRVGVSDRTDPYAAHDAALTAELERSLRAHVGTFSRGPRGAVRDAPRTGDRAGCTGTRLHRAGCARLRLRTARAPWRRGNSSGLGSMGR